MKDVLTIKASNHLDTQTLLITQDVDLHKEVWCHVKALVGLRVFEDASDGSEVVLAPYMDEINSEFL
ncbi:hypothetical protein ACEQ8A_000405 [Vibrio fluvialis]|nr:hypothetical protein [Vibrio fluvialis]ELX9690746.1 hypothetical protein [Vibrio fluvialis]